MKTKHLLRALLAVLVISFLPRPLMAQDNPEPSGRKVTNAKFAIGKWDITPAMEAEITSMCPILKNEEHIEVTGYYDHLDYNLDTRYRNFMLSVFRATAVIGVAHKKCDIPLERFGPPRGTNHVGDPRDPEGRESRTASFSWAWVSSEDHQVYQQTYQDELMDLMREWRLEDTAFQREWRTESTDNQAEMLALMYQMMRDMSYSRLTYEYVTSDSLTVSVRSQPWSVRFGLSASGEFGTLYTGSLYREFPDRNLAVGIEVSAEEQSHTRQLFERPTSDAGVPHWGTYQSMFVLMRRNFDDGDIITPFIEWGGGVVHVEYDGPPASIGWHHTAVDFTIRAGLSARYGIIGFNAFVGADAWKFAQSSVLPDIADNNFHPSWRGGGQITLHF